MSYYATVLEHAHPRRICWAAGPFDRHGDALAAADEIRREIMPTVDPDAHWHAYGTAHDRAGRSRAGKLNGRLSAPIAARLAAPTIRTVAESNTGPLGPESET